MEQMNFKNEVSEDTRETSSKLRNLTNMTSSLRDGADIIHEDDDIEQTPEFSGKNKQDI